MKIVHNGYTYDVYVGQWTDLRRKKTPKERALMDAAVTHGTLFDGNGTPLTGAVAQRVRTRLLGTHDDPEWQAPDGRVNRPRRDGQRRYLLPGVWPWGHLPLLAGNQKAGKTTLVVGELVPALVVPGWRFLDRFDPVQWPGIYAGRQGAQPGRVASG